MISDQHHGHIVDIRAGRAGDDEPIHRLEGMVGIVVLQHIVHLQLVLRQCRGRAAVHIAARSIGWAVGAIAAHRKDRCIQPGDHWCCSKGQLLIAPAQTCSGQMDDRLTACKKGQLFSLPRVGAGYGTKEAASLPRFTAEPVGQDHRLIAQLPAGVGCCAAQLPHAAGDLRGNTAQHLWSLLCQQSLGLCRKLQVIFFRNGKGLCTGGGIRHRRAAGDHIQRVAQNIAEHDAEHLRGRTVLCKPPALDPGQALANGVHLHDIGTAGKQLARDLLQLCAGDQRLLKQCTAAAGQQKQHRILCR